MKILLLETSTEKSFVALGTFYPECEVVREIELSQPSSKSLYPALQSLFSTDIKAIIVGVGPGSYTGIRVGVAAGKGLAYALKIPLITVSGIQGLVGPFPYISVIDARFSGVYAAFPEKEAKVYSIEDFQKNCPKETLIVSPHPEVLKRRLKFSKFLETCPESSFLLQKAKVKWENDDYSRKAEAEILYLRETQAETELKRKRAVE